MKSERRHELEQNSLAQWLTENADRVKPYANTILGVLLVIVLAVLVYNWWSGNAATNKEVAWDEMLGATSKALSTQDASDLDLVAENHPNSKAGLWAAVTAGDLRLAFGADSRFSNKDVADDDLKAAVENYHFVLDEARDSVLRERATFGLARAYETQGDLEKAVERYKEVVQHYPDGLYKPVAQDRLAFLESPAGKSFYKKFAQFKPEPALADEPGTPGARPEFDLDSLTTPETPAASSAAPAAESAPTDPDDTPADSAGNDLPE